jgi:hypothetical protein
MALQQAYGAYRAWVFVTYEARDLYDSEAWIKVQKQIASDKTLAGEFIRTYWMLANNSSGDSRSALAYVRVSLKDRGYGYTFTSSRPLLSDSIKKSTPYSTASTKKPQSGWKGKSKRRSRSPRHTAKPAHSETGSSMTIIPTSSSDQQREALIPSPSSRLESDAKNFETSSPPPWQDPLLSRPAPSQNAFLCRDGYNQDGQRETNRWYEL